MINPKNKLMKNKKGQLITGLIGGISALIILVIVSFLIVDTLNSADLISQTTTTGLNATTIVLVNDTYTGTTLEITAYTNPSCAVSRCINESSETLISPTNYTVTANTCNIRYDTDAGAGDHGFNNSLWICEYSVTSDSGMQKTTDYMIMNYTKGIDNVSAKVPTILLVAAVVLLFGAIVLLVMKSRETTSSTGGGL